MLLRRIPRYSSRPTGSGCNGLAISLTPDTVSRMMNSNCWARRIGDSAPNTAGSARLDGRSSQGRGRLRRQGVPCPRPPRLDEHRHVAAGKRCYASVSMALPGKISRRRHRLHSPEVARQDKARSRSQRVTARHAAWGGATRRRGRRCARVGAAWKAGKASHALARLGLARHRRHRRASPYGRPGQPSHRRTRLSLDATPQASRPQARHAFASRRQASHRTAGAACQHETARRRDRPGPAGSMAQGETCLRSPGLGWAPLGGQARRGRIPDKAGMGSASLQRWSRQPAALLHHT